MKKTKWEYDRKTLHYREVFSNGNASIVKGCNGYQLKIMGNYIGGFKKLSSAKIVAKLILYG